jgi:hypothetical protein
MSEDEYKELYLKYKVKYINLKNNNQSGGGLLDYINLSTATEVDIDRIDKEYNDEIKAKIFKELQKLVSKIILYSYNNTHNDDDDDDEDDNEYILDKNSILTELVYKYEKSDPTKFSNYNNINDKIINFLEIVKEYYAEIQKKEITKDEYLMRMYNLCNKIKELLINFNNDNREVIDYIYNTLNKPNFEYNMFKKYLLLTEDENRFIYLMLIHGPSTQTSSDTIFQTYYKSAIDTMKKNKYSIRQVKIKMKCLYENIYKNNYAVINIENELKNLFNKCF